MSDISDMSASDNQEKLSDEDAKIREMIAFIADLARQGNTDQLLAYIKAGVPVDLVDREGNSLVMLAAYNGNDQTTQALLELGADPNLVNDRGQSPLGGVVFKDYPHIAQQLVIAGANPDIGQPSAHEIAYFFEKIEQYEPIFAMGKSHDSP